jgi:tRNA(fMet)-specific endonuclease VapC
MIYLLDTDVFTLAHRGSRGLRERIDAEWASSEVVVSLITRIEVLRGRLDSVLKAADGAALVRSQDVLRSSEAFLANFRVLSFDAAAAGSSTDSAKTRKPERLAATTSSSPALRWPTTPRS